LELKLSVLSTVPIRVFSDAKRFKQVLFNLLGNAVKFTFKGGIYVDLDFDKDLETLFCTIKDTGIGIE
jgi:signal transduction histidine kinase